MEFCNLKVYLELFTAHRSSRFRNNYNLEDLVDKVIQIGIDGIKNIRNELTEKNNGI